MSGLEKLNLKRRRPPEDDDETAYQENPSISQGPVDKVIELAFNPSREKIREVTIIDRMQGRLFPLMDMMNALFGNCIEVAVFRQSRADYKLLYGKDKPAPLDITEVMMYRIAQWQKSVQGKNLERATDIALAETETRAPEDGDPMGEGRGIED